MIEKQFSIMVGRSKWLLGYFIFVHGLMMLMMVSLIPNLWLSLAVVLMLSASFIYYCRRHQWLKSQHAVITIARDDKHNWRLSYADGAVQEKCLLKHCVVTPSLVMLNFTGISAGKGQSVTITADAVNAELFRQLRVYLRNPKTFQQ